MLLPCLSETSQTRALLPKAEKNSSSECVLSFIGFSATRRGRYPQVGRELSSCFLDVEFSGFLGHRLSFPVLGSRVALMFEARQLPVGQGGRGRDPRLCLLNCTSSLYCLSFRHLRFLSLGSKVTANFLAIHTSHKRSGNNVLRAIKSEHRAALALGRLPLQPLPRLENQTVLGEPEITPFAAERQGGGAGAKAGRAGHGVERAMFTGSGGFTLAELGA